MAYIMLHLRISSLLLIKVYAIPYHGLLEIYENMVEVLLMLQVLLAEDPDIGYLLCGAPSSSETSLRFCNDLFSLWLKMIFIITLLRWLIMVL